MPHLRRFSAEWVYVRICGKSVEILEKEGMYREAVSLLRSILSQKEFCVNSRGTYWERITIDTERYLKNPDLVCMEMYYMFCGEMSEGL